MNTNKPHLPYCYWQVIPRLINRNQPQCKPCLFIIPCIPCLGRLELQNRSTHTYLFPVYPKFPRGAYYSGVLSYMGWPNSDRDYNTVNGCEAYIIYGKGFLLAWQKCRLCSLCVCIQVSNMYVLTNKVIVSPLLQWRHTSSQASATPTF